MRNERERAGLPTVALAGYTNAGKSTLLNALTGAEVGVRDRLFHTLDPTTRQMEISGRTYLLTDTVGFIRKLPHQLVEAFGATLEEAMGADLLVHVVDASAPEEELHEMLSAVEDVLEEIGAGEVPIVLALNKADLLDAERRRELSFRFPKAVQVSAATGEGLDDLREADRGPVPGHAPVDGAAAALRRGRVAVRAARRWPARSSARTRPRAWWSAPACRRWPPPASSASRSTASTDGAALPAAGRRGHAARAGPRRRRRASTCSPPRPPSWDRGSGRPWAPASPWPSPRGTPAWCCRARAWPASTG